MLDAETDATLVVTDVVAIVDIVVRGFLVTFVLVALQKDLNTLLFLFVFLFLFCLVY